MKVGVENNVGPARSLWCYLIKLTGLFMFQNNFNFHRCAFKYDNFNCLVYISDDGIDTEERDPTFLNNMND